MPPGSEALRDLLPNDELSWIVLAISAVVAITVLILRERAARRDHKQDTLDTTHSSMR